MTMKGCPYGKIDGYVAGLMAPNSACTLFVEVSHKFLGKRGDVQESRGRQNRL